MKSLIITTMLMVSTLFLSGCSGDNEVEEPSKIDQMTKKAGQEAANWIKTPLDKARNAAGKEEESVHEFNERRKESENN